MSGISTKHRWPFHMTARDMPHFNCGCLLFTPAVAWGTTLFLPICAHTTKGLGCVCSLDLWKAPVPQPAAQMTGAMQSWPVGMYKLVPVSVACVGSSLLACPSETSQDSTMGSSMARGRRGENVGDSGCAQRGLPGRIPRPYRNLGMGFFPFLNPSLHRAWAVVTHL